MNIRQVKHFDVIIIGAGAAGLMCALTAGGRGRKVLLLDHSAKPAEKIRISGGGRCNFTNLYAAPQNFISQNPHFCVSALKRYSQHDFINLVKKHNIAFHEKTLGQLFCDGSSQQIIDMLLAECQQAGVSLQLATKVERVEKTSDGFSLVTSAGEFESKSLVIASGGIAIPKMGASGFGYDIARQFGLNIVPTRAALVPFTLAADELKRLSGLAGVAVEAIASIGKQHFREGLLFTHRGLSGPAILQISSYWQDGQKIMINLAPEYDVAKLLLAAKMETPKQELATRLAMLLPKRLAQEILQMHCADKIHARLADIADRDLRRLAAAISAWAVVPSGTEGYRTAEVTAGGVDTDELSSKTMESKKISGLFFIGEVVDVTGHLGGFNFQWAWSSGHAAGQFV